MNYSQNEFFALIESVEAQGGEHMDESCVEFPTYAFSGSSPIPEGMAPLRNCGNPALFVVPYESPLGGVAPLQACAVDDSMGRWPRFGGDRFAGPEHYVAPNA